MRTFLAVAFLVLIGVVGLLVIPAGRAAPPQEVSPSKRERAEATARRLVESRPLPDRTEVASPYVAPFSDATLHIDPEFHAPTDTKEYLHFVLNRASTGDVDKLDAAHMVAEYSNGKSLSEAEHRGLINLIEPYNQQIMELQRQSEKLKLAAWHESVVTGMFSSFDLAFTPEHRYPTPAETRTDRAHIEQVRADLDARFGRDNWFSIESNSPPRQPSRQYCVYLTRDSAPQVFEVHDAILMVVAERRNAASRYMASIGR